MYTISKIDKPENITVKELFPDHTNTTRKTYYFDDNGNEVSREEATNAMICEYDKDGHLISEKRAIIQKKNEQNKTK